MPTSARRARLLVDTSVAVALSVTDHEGRADAVAAVRGARLGLAGHAAFETFSVLTRLPAPARLTAAAAVRLLTTNFPDPAHLSAQAALRLLPDLAELGVAGGSVYDALVGAAAREHRRPLVTADRRALATYHALNVEIVLVRTS